MLRKGHILAILVISISVITVVTIQAQSDSTIPLWIKTTAGFWVNDQVTDSEFISALQYLIKEGIIVIPQDDVTTKSTSTTTQPSSAVNTPSPITEKYLPTLEAFNIEGNNMLLLVTVLDQAGKPIKVFGEINIQILDFDDKQLYDRKKYVTSDIFEFFTNDISGKKVYGFQSTIQSGKIMGGINQENYYNNGMGTMILTFTDKDESYENEIQLSHLPINEGYFKEKTGFIDHFEVDKVLDVGPFFVTVKDVGRYMGEDEEKGDAPKEFFKINLNSKSKFIEGVNFKLDEIYIMDEKNRLYSSDEKSIENFINVFLGQSYEYEGGNGYILFEEIPSDVKDITLILKMTRIEGDVSDTHYEDELKISLR